MFVVVGLMDLVAMADRTGDTLGESLVAWVTSFEHWLMQWRAAFVDVKANRDALAKIDSAPTAATKTSAPKPQAKPTRAQAGAQHQQPSGNKPKGGAPTPTAAAAAAAPKRQRDDGSPADDGSSGGAPKKQDTRIRYTKCHWIAEDGETCKSVAPGNGSIYALCHPCRNRLNTMSAAEKKDHITRIEASGKCKVVT